MGYELKKIMGQFGVSTPGMVNYSGAAAPGKPPAVDATQADKDAFDESVRKYNLDNKSYDIYKREYGNRLDNSPGMYSQPQFNTGTYTTQVMPQLRAPLTAPTYGSVSPGMLNLSRAEQQNYYNSQRDIGYTANDLRKAAVNSLGQTANNQPALDYMESIYNPNYVPAATGGTTGSPATGGTTPPGTVTDFLMRNPDGTPMTDLTPINDFGFSPENPEFYYGKAHGGAVKTHYQTAGRVVLPGGYVEEEDVIPPTTVIPPQVAVAPSDRMADLQSMLAAYGPSESIYAEELKTSRDRARQESDAFATMLNGAMSSPESDSNSKAELYFRLASAFGAPTKTGQFSENIGLVGKEMSEYAKDRRASSQDRFNLSLKAQELKMGAAKEDLSTLRSLAAEEMRDKRAISTEMIKEYVASGKPQSNAGQQARDEGLQMGTTEFAARVQELSQIDINRQIQMTQLQLDNLNLRSEKQQQLSPTEIALKTKTEDNIGSLTTALNSLSQAYALNPNSLDGGWIGKTRQFLGNISSSDDPIYVNTRQIDNLLGSQALELLRATFGGAPTEGERAILLELQGIGSATKEDRAKIMMRAYIEIQKSLAREQGRLEQINSGAYRMTNIPPPIDGGIQ